MVLLWHGWNFAGWAWGVFAAAFLRRAVSLKGYAGRNTPAGRIMYQCMVVSRFVQLHDPNKADIAPQRLWQRRVLMVTLDLLAPCVVRSPSTLHPDALNVQSSRFCSGFFLRMPSRPSPAEVYDR